MSDPFTIATKHWHRLRDSRVSAMYVTRVKLHEAWPVFRPRPVDDQVEAHTSYGRSSGCVDPIEKKPLNHFLPGSATLSFGTAEYGLACKF